MVDAAKLWQRCGTGFVSVLAGAVVFWVAMHSVGSDWFISQTHADILFTAVWRFHEFPFFSFVFGGGSYFIQDPQSNLFSFVNPLVLLTGPSNGLRIAEGLWGAVGCYAYIVWMRRHVSELAAQFGALAWCLSLGVFWRVAVGNDMFLWHLGLPIFLLLIEKVISERTWQSGVALGLSLGVFLLGPTFHTFTYLFVPVLPLFGVLALVTLRPGFHALPRIGLLLVGALLLGVLIASPKFACWMKFPMGRPTPDPGDSDLYQAASSLVDYTYTSWFKLPMGHRPGRNRAWGIEEAAVALPPPATLLIPLGVVVGLFSRRRRAHALFALLISALGLTISASEQVWEYFRTLTNGNFRVALRYHALPWFGFTMLTTHGADALFGRFARARAPIAATFFGGVLAAAIWWVDTAGRVTERALNDTIQPEMMNPITMGRDEMKLVSELKSFDQLVFFNELAPDRYFLFGNGTTNGFLVVGNPYDKRRWISRRPVPTVTNLPPGASTVSHTRIVLRDVPAHHAVGLKLIDPRFGLDIQTVPPAAKMTLSWDPAGLTIENVGDQPIKRLVIRPRLPISVAWFVLSLLALVAALAALTYPRWSRRVTVLRRFTFSV